MAQKEMMTPKQMAIEFRRRATELVKAAEIIEREVLGIDPRDVAILEDTPDEPQTISTQIAKAMRLTRRERQLVEYLTEHGPSSFRDIVAHSGIPQGTVSTVLRKTRVIRRNEQGEWEVVPREEQEKEDE